MSPKASLICGVAAVLAAWLPSRDGAIADPALGSDGVIVAGGPCDRACMMGLTEDYLQAMIARDPHGVLWATLPKYTENGVVLAPGQGQLWAHTTGLGRYRNVFVDRTGGQVGYLGVVYEDAKPAYIGMRLKFAGRRVSEAEVVIGDRMGAGEEAEALGSPPAIFQEPIAAAARGGRVQLIAAADTYFTGLEQIDGDKVPFASDCERVENGGQTTNVKDLAMAPMSGVADAGSWRIHFKQGCRDQINSGMFAYITEIRNRRYEVIDEERGNILSFAIFDHPGGIKRVALPGEAPIDMPAGSTRPFDTYVAEAFHVRGGQIHRIEAAIVGGKLGMESGWPDRPRIDR